MPPFSRERRLAFFYVQDAWFRAMAHSRRAGSSFAIAGIVFTLGQVRFSTLVPVAEASLWELVIWLSSAALLLPTLLWFGHAVWREWRAYRRLAALAGHPGAAVGSTRRARLDLFREFCRTGRG